LSFRNLGEFIACLEEAGELERIRKPVSPRLEITEITDRMCKSSGGGKALLFENVAGSVFPVLTNAFGSMRRIGLALGSTPDALAERLREILELTPPASFLEKLSMAGKAVSWSRFLPRLSGTKRPPCREVVYRGGEVNLHRLPVLHCWPEDGGPFVTLPVVFTKGLSDGKRNVGMYRMQVYDRNTTGMHWHVHKDGAHHFKEYREAGRRMEVAVAIGTDPAVTYAATAPMPRGVDEMILAGFIRRKPVTMVKCLTVDLEVPAESEFVLEGYVDPGETRIEGPFGDHTGYYSLADEYPVFHVTAVTHRANPVYSATVVGRPPMEDCYLAYVTERLFLPMIRTMLPEIRDYWLPWEGVFHNIVVVAMEKAFPGHASKVMSGLWGMGQMSFAKMIVTVDDESLLRKGGALLAHILDTVDPWTDLTFTHGILDVLDHSAPQGLHGLKVGIDATFRVAGEMPRTRRERMAPPMGGDGILRRLRATDSGFVSVRKLFEERVHPLVLVGVAKGGARSSRSFLERIPQDVLGQGIVVLYDDGVDLTDGSLVLWKAFNNVDPARDIHVHPAGVVVDATRKGPMDGHMRTWPDEIRMTEEIRALVDEKFKDLFVSSGP